MRAMDGVEDELATGVTVPVEGYLSSVKARV